MAMVGKARDVQSPSRTPKLFALVVVLGAASSCALVIGVDGNFIVGELGGEAGTTFTTSTSAGGATTTTLVGGGGATGPGGSGGEGGAGGDGLLANGAPCALGTECRSALCVDEVCCDTACLAACESCLAVDTEADDGTCAPVSLGSDPAGDCVAPERCDGAGACTDVGLECPLGTECTTHDCVDGVCCDTACDGACVACDGLLTGAPAGTCAPLPLGQADPDHCQPTEICGPAGCFDCALSPTPPGGACPSDPCDGGCDGNVCRIICSANNECKNTLKTCPAGFACEVVCSGSGSCDGATIDCPDDYSCVVACSCAGPPNGCCANATVLCGSGTCEMTCSAASSACSGASLACGLRDCVASCEGGTQPAVSCPTDAVCGCDGC